MNELLLLFQMIIISCFAILSLYWGSHTLVAFICLQSILANLFVVKQITLFGFTATGADAFIVGAVLGLQLLQEYYGKKIAQHTIWSAFVLLVFYSIMSQCLLWYTPHSSDIAHQHFNFLFSVMPRITLASISVYITTLYVDSTLYALFKKLTDGKYLLIRNFAAMALSQLFDTILFSFLGLYGIIENIGQIIVISYCIKMTVTLVASPFVLMAKKYIPLPKK